jgi:GT2 family glycosyltransferase
MEFLFALMKVLPRHPLRGLVALYWYITRRRVRARHRLRYMQEQSPAFYEVWIRDVERVDHARLEADARKNAGTCHPRISVIVYLDPIVSAAGHERSIQSVTRQAYEDWELFIVPSPATASPVSTAEPRIRHLPPAANAAAALQAAVIAAHGSYILPLRAGDALATAALLRFVEALHDCPLATVLYGDEDEVCSRGRRARPYFKPEWNEEMFLAQDYISASCLIRTDTARAALPIAHEFDGVAAYTLLLQHLEPSAQRKIVHVPHIVCHRDRTRPDELQETRRQVVASHLRRIGSAATAVTGKFGSVRVSWPQPEDPPLVSVIIPTRDKLHLLRACLRGVLGATRYPNLEVLVVDNGSVKSATHRYFEEIRQDRRVRVLRYPGAYNYSAINNFAVREALGSYICLLNNDTEILHGDWLSEMMCQAVRPHVGAVGAKLLYADRSIQHAGVIVGLGDAAGHAHRFLPDDEPGYFNHAHLPQYVSAVTAACLVVEKRKFLEVGGLDETHLAIAFNDADLCLKLGDAGWRNIYTPHAMLIHHESKSRRRDSKPSEQSRYRRELETLQTRWQTAGFKDPCHHPNLSRASETFQIGFRRLEPTGNSLVATR